MAINRDERTSDHSVMERKRERERDGEQILKLHLKFSKLERTEEKTMKKTEFSKPVEISVDMPNLMTVNI